MNYPANSGRKNGSSLFSPLESINISKQTQINIKTDVYCQKYSDYKTFPTKKWIKRIETVFSVL